MIEGIIKVLIVTIVFVFISCGQGGNTNETVESSTNEKVVSQKDKKIEIALTFINGYVDNSNKLNKAIGIIEWVNSNDLTTKAFKIEVKKIIDEAYKQDPELGLDADPIVDAQDYPSKGFELESLDEQTNFLIVKGKDWPEFKLIIKVVEENGKCLVDGCGIVNIPKDKRAAR